MNSKVFALFVTVLACIVSQASAVGYYDFWNITTPEEMRKVDPSFFKMFSYQDAKHLSEKQSASCAGLLPEQMANIPMPNYYGFENDCTAKWSVGVCGSLDDDHMKHLSFNAVWGFLPSCIFSLNPNACVDLKVGAIKTKYFSDVKPSCIAKISPDDLADLTEQIAEMTGSQCAAITPAQMNMMYDFDRMSNTCIEHFSPASCANINRLSWFTVKNIASISAKCASYLPGKACATLSDKTAAALTPSVIRSMSPDCINNWPERAFLELTSAQCGAFNLQAYAPKTVKLINEYCYM
eukprot:TRINITY_DN16662_c0_g1_i1.p1 TRINITY_DN16662_c0_g1~~TRINITY_DN16662_c0_g1_i1.p1  ORF type:complete len:295 (-),score=96.98 TRINITY_DN16662_c0_g1_i1:220-1104(-)